MNKEKILEAIAKYDVYNHSTKLVLKALVATSNEKNVSNISIKALSDLSTVSRQGVYNAFRYIERDGVIKRTKESGSSATLFEFDLSKLDKILSYSNHLKEANSMLKKL